MNNNNIAPALLSLLSKGIVRFSFRKVDGTIREALGTRNLDVARKFTGEYIAEPKTGRSNPTAYYDIEKMGWRSFVASNILSIGGIDIKDIKGISASGAIIGVGEPVEVEIPINVTAEPTEPLGFDLGKVGKFLGVDLGKVGGCKVGTPTATGCGKVGTPTETERGIELPVGDVSVTDFAKMVAHYVVDELANRLK